MEPFLYKEPGGIPIVTLSAWADISSGLTVGMSARDHYSLHREQDDPLSVVPNREQLAHALGFSLTAWTSGEQVHGAVVARVGKRERGAGNRDHQTALSGTDGLITNEPDVLLTAYYADCVPLFFWDSEHGAIGVAHAGWRGTAAGIGREMVKQMATAFSTEPDAFHVAIGPAIGACCYEVDDQVIEALLTRHSPISPAAVQAKANGRYWLDLKQANAEVVTDAGVPSHQILVTEYCTCCEKRLFFSHRRDAQKAGRMVAWIGKMKG